MLQEFTFQAGEETYAVCYTARARFLFEQWSGYHLGKLQLWKGDAGDVEVARLVAAGLEGHRARTKSRRVPWTVDEVLDQVLADLDATARQEVLRVCVDAVHAAFKVSEAATGAEGKPPAAG